MTDFTLTEKQLEMQKPRNFMRVQMNPSALPLASTLIGEFSWLPITNHFSLITEC